MAAMASSTTDAYLLAIGKGTVAGMPGWTERFRQLPWHEQDRALELLRKNHEYTCLKCGSDLDKGEQFCPECGKKNPGYLPEADSRIPANRKSKKAGRVKKSKYQKRVKAQKALARGFIVKSDTGRSTRWVKPLSPKAALRASLRAELDSPDPAIRLYAAGALEKL
jgi:uncharacterized Zn finger protein (UPF0148 family)